jgi:transposase
MVLHGVIYLYQEVSMHLNQLKESKSGRIFLSFQETHRVKGKNKTTTVKRIGYLDEFISLYEDPIAHFKELAKQLSIENKVEISASLDEHYTFDTQYSRGDDSSYRTEGLVYHLGILPLSQIYHEMEIDYFMNNRRRYTKAKFNHNTILQMLVFGRILFPDSKLGTWNNRHKLLGEMTFSDDDVYRSLEFFAKHKTALIRHLNDRVSRIYGRDTTLMFYDVTNYYWEIDQEDAIRKRGVSKEHRPEPIVQMGLLMDSNDLPITYNLFPGNTNDALTLSPTMGDVTEELGTEGIVYIADKGMMSGDNRAEILINRGGYIFSNSVRKADQQTKAYVIDEKGFIINPEGTYKYKSRIVPVTIQVTSQLTGTKKSIVINERQIIFWSRKYQERTRHERSKTIEKAANYGTCENNHGGNRFFKKIVMNKVDGEVLRDEDKAYVRVFDEDLLSKEAALDGYYMICTNVIGLEPDEKPFAKQSRFLSDNLFQLNRPVADHDIIDMYRGLWRIEESFRITKSWLKARPVFVHTEASIEAHFLTCFLGLLLLRILELKTDHSIELNRMIEDLRDLKVVEESPDLFLLTPPTNVIEKIGEYFNLDLIKKRYTMQELKKMVAKTKKTS